MAYGEDEDDASSGEDEDDRHAGGDVPGLQSKEGDDSCDEGSYLCCFWGEGVEDLHRRRQTKRERVSLLKKILFICEKDLVLFVLFISKMSQLKFLIELATCTTVIT